MKCYIENTSIKFYSQGGFRYFTVFKNPVEQILPLENGIIVKLLDDPNYDWYDPNWIDIEIGFKYVSIIDHPHDIPTPIGIYQLGMKQ